MTFGERLKYLRKMRGLTQTQLGEALQLTKANISKYESNRIEPNLETLKLMTKIFDVSADDLLGIDTAQTKGVEPPLTFKQKNLLKSCEGLSDDDLQKICEYTALLKLKKHALQQEKTQLAARSGSKKQIETDKKKAGRIADGLTEDTTSDY